jgi:hypothetical protein
MLQLSAFYIHSFVEEWRSDISSRFVLRFSFEIINHLCFKSCTWNDGLVLFICLLLIESFAILVQFFPCFKCLNWLNPMHAFFSSSAKHIICIYYSLFPDLKSILYENIHENWKIDIYQSGGSDFVEFIGESPVRFLVA